jgi:hypothetical protein
MRFFCRVDPGAGGWFRCTSTLFTVMPSRVNWGENKKNNSKKSDSKWLNNYNV